MKKLFSFFIGLQVILMFSCHISHDREIICQGNFMKASKLAYNNPTSNAALDSALIILNTCMQCDSIKNLVIDLKIRLLITLGKFNEGSGFVDSLKTSDFTYPYEKKLANNNFIALNFASNGDTISRDKMYQQMCADLEKYIKNNTLGTKEFQESYLQLFDLKRNFVDTIKIIQEIDSLKKKYPNNAKFFDFLKS